MPLANTTSPYFLLECLYRQLLRKNLGYAWRPDNVSTRLDSFVSFVNEGFRDFKGFRFVHSVHPVSGWLNDWNRTSRCLRSTSITEASSLLLSDPPLCSVLVLKPLWVLITWVSPLTPERQVLMFRIKACFMFMPPKHRLPLYPNPNTVKAHPSSTLSHWFWQRIFISMLHRMVHFRSSPWNLPDEWFRCFPIAHDLYS